MRKWLIVVLVSVVVVAVAVSYFSLSEKARRAEENVRRVELLYMGDAVALSAEMLRLSAGGGSDERYEAGESLRAELTAWDSAYQSALSEAGAFAFVGRGAALDALSDRRGELNERIQAFLAVE